jgi:hypothetical protein
MEYPEIRYHLSPKTCRPEVCDAHKRPCRFGTHYSSFKEAIAKSEEIIARNASLSAKNGLVKSSLKKPFKAPTEQWDSETTNTMFFSLSGAAGRDVAEGIGGDLRKELIPGDYHAYVYDEASEDDVSVVLHVDHDGNMTSDAYKDIPKDKATSIPLGDRTQVIFAFGEKVSSATNNLEELAVGADSPEDEEVYIENAQALRSIRDGGNYSDLNMGAEAMHQLVELRDDWESEYELGDDDDPRREAYKTSVFALDGILPDYMKSGLSK